VQQKNDMLDHSVSLLRDKVSVEVSCLQYMFISVKQQSIRVLSTLLLKVVATTAATTTMETTILTGLETGEVMLNVLFVLDEESKSEEVSNYEITGARGDKSYFDSLAWHCVGSGTKLAGPPI
jgi:hypothetical protein